LLAYRHADFEFRISIFDNFIPMDIIEFLNIDSSRINADLLVEKFEDDRNVFKTLLDVTYQDTYPLSMRSSRVIWLIGKKYPGFIKPYLPDMIKRLPRFKVDAVRRNILTILIEVPLPDIDLGKLFDVCYLWLQSDKEPVAIRGNSVTVLYKISEIQPELKGELIELFESLLPCSSRGIETRIKDMINRLNRDIKLSSNNK
jgi:hypothetical protein